MESSINIPSTGQLVLFDRFTIFFGKQLLSGRIDVRADGVLGDTTRTLHFGLGEYDTVTIRVVWPDGTERVLESVSVNRRLVVQRDGPVARVAMS